MTDHEKALKAIAEEATRDDIQEAVLVTWRNGEVSVKVAAPDASAAWASVGAWVIKESL